MCCHSCVEDDVYCMTQVYLYFLPHCPDISKGCHHVHVLLLLLFCNDVTALNEYTMLLLSPMVQLTLKKSLGLMEFFLFFFLTVKVLTAIPLPSTLCSLSSWGPFC